MKKIMISILASAVLCAATVTTAFAAQTDIEQTTEPLEAAATADAQGELSVGAPETEAEVEPATQEATEATTEAATEPAPQNPSYPEISNIIAVNKGFKINWNSYEGAGKYRVFVKVGERWKALGDTGNLTYTYTGITNDLEYTFTVRALDNSGNYASSYYSDGWKATNLSTPKLSSVQSANGAVKVSWNSIQGAQSYTVFKKTGSSGWSVIGYTSSNSFTDTSVEAGKDYTYTVRCITADKKSYTSYYDEKGLGTTYVSVPTVTRIDNVANGAKITWGKCEGAYKYRVFIKNASGWSRLADTSSTSVVHTAAKSGTEYTYTVRVYDKKGNYTSAYYTNGWTNTFLSVPELSSAQSTGDGIKITWKKVEGAQAYRVFVRNGNEWLKRTDTESLSFTDKYVTSGKNYKYTVRCISSDAKKYTSYYNENGIVAKFVSVPMITKITNAANGAQLSWGNVDGAYKYRVFVKNGSGWSRLADTSATSLVHTAAKSNTEYTYTVRAFDQNGNYTSDYYTSGWTNKFLSVPVLSSASNIYEGVKINWSKVDGAEKYRVFVKDGKSWKHLTDTTSLNYTDTTVSPKSDYTYTVRCLSADGKAYTSYYNENGITVRFLSAPKISKIENGSSSAKLEWESVEGAAKYRLFEWTGSSWKNIVTTTATNYGDTNVSDAQTKIYTVRALDSSNNYITGYYYSGWSNIFFAPPKFASVTASGNSPVLSWDKKSGVTKYRVYRKTYGGSW